MGKIKEHLCKCSIVLYSIIPLLQSSVVGEAVFEKKLLCKKLNVDLVENNEIEYTFSFGLISLCCTESDPIL